MLFVVDASVAVKWFIPENGWEVAARLLNEDIQRVAPDLVVAEIGNTLWKKVQRNELTARTAVEIADGFQRFDLELHRSADLLPSAVILASALQRPVYDSLYLALAVELECRMVTADRKLLKALWLSPFAEHILAVEDLPLDIPPPQTYCIRRLIH